VAYRQVKYGKVILLGASSRQKKAGSKLILPRFLTVEYGRLEFYTDRRLVFDAFLDRD
jgi:hypothetical protein